MVVLAQNEVALRGCQRVESIANVRRILPAGIGERNECHFFQFGDWHSFRPSILLNEPRRYADVSSTNMLLNQEKTGGIVIVDEDAQRRSAIVFPYDQNFV